MVHLAAHHFRSGAFRGPKRGERNCADRWGAHRSRSSLCHTLGPASAGPCSASDFWSATGGCARRSINSTLGCRGARARVRSNRDGHLVPSSGAGELFQIRLAGCDRAGPYDTPIGAAACGRGNSVMAVQSNRQTCLGLVPGLRRAGRARIGRQC